MRYSNARWRVSSSPTAVLLASLFALALPGPTSAQAADPTGRLTELTDLQSLRDAFNGDVGRVRLVALLSPTCAYCVKGYRYMRKLLEEIPDENLRMYVVWEPMLSADSREIAVRQARRAKDFRLTYQAWDEDRVTGVSWQELMGHSGVAWDVYYLYGPDHRWAPDLTDPDYYQHQGDGPRELRLDYGNLKREILALLGEDL